MMQGKGNQKKYMDPNKQYHEINTYVVGWGFFYALLFTLSMEYLALKVGQTVDAAMPVSILAMSMAVVFKRMDPFPEAVHIQALASSGTNVIVAVIFVMPAFFILDMQGINMFLMVVPVFFGSVMGILLASIFRRYFCVEKDKDFPFPNGRAGANLLTSSGTGGGRLIIISGIVGFVYDFVLDAFGAWAETFSTELFSWGQVLHDKLKVTLTMGMDVALLGVGYFTGIRYAAIIASGTFMANLVFIPVLYYLAGDHVMTVNGEEILLANASITQVFSKYVRSIGIGMMAMAGIIGLLSMGKAVLSIAKQTIKNMRNISVQDSRTARNDRDISPSLAILGIALCIMVFGVFYHFYFSGTLLESVLVTLVLGISSILLAIVGISSTAYTGNEPVSGITLFLMLIMGAVLNATGAIGESGVTSLIVIAVFGASCISLAGNFMTELKIAYLTGATPAVMQKWQVIMAVFISVVSIVVLLFLNSAYGFAGENALPAPQANAMAAVSSSLMSGNDAPWILYMAGAFGAIAIWMLGVPVLPFALGVYLPMDINTPVLAGGILSYLVASSTKDEALKTARMDKGSSIAAGLVGGGAIGGLVQAVMQIGGVNLYMHSWSKTPEAAFLAIAIYLAIMAFVYKMAVKTKEKE